MQPSLIYDKVRAVKTEPLHVGLLQDGHCRGPKVCPLSRVPAGATVCIKKLATAPSVSDRLRELGFCEEQKIRVVSRQSTFICQVCNARLGISEELANSILVETAPALVS